MLDRIRGKSSSVLTWFIFGLIIIAFIFIGVGRYSGSSSNTALEVNGEDISLQEFARSYRAVYQRELETNPERIANEAAQENLKFWVARIMAQNVLQQQETRRLGLFVSPQELFRVVSHYAPFCNEQGVFEPERYQRVLAEQGQSPAQFEETVRGQILSEKLAGLIASSADTTEEEARSDFNFQLEQRIAEYVLFAKKDYAKQVVVSDEAIRHFYESKQAQLTEPERIDADYLLVTAESLASRFTPDEQAVKAYYQEHQDAFRIPAEYKLRHILVSSSAGGSLGEKAGLQEQDALLDEIQTQLAQGRPFVELAKEYSKDQSSAMAGGDLGWVRLDEIPLPEFVQAVEGLTPGGVSAPISSALGQSIFFLEDKKEPRMLSLDEARKAVSDELRLSEARLVEDALRKEISVDLNNGLDLAKIAEKHSLEIQHSGLVEKNLLAKQLHLQANAIAVLDHVPAGDLAPIPLDLAGGFAVVQVLAAQPAHVPPLEAVADKIRTAIQDQEEGLLAKQAAVEALPLFGEAILPQEFANNALLSQPFSRAMPLVMPLGNAQGLADALNALPVGPWAQQTFDVAEGTVIARVHMITPVAAGEWQQYGARLFQEIAEQNKGQALTNYMERLFVQSKIEIHSEALARVPSQ